MNGKAVRKFQPSHQKAGAVSCCLYFQMNIGHRRFTYFFNHSIKLFFIKTIKKS